MVRPVIAYRSSWREEHQRSITVGDSAFGMAGGVVWSKVMAACRAGDSGASWRGGHAATRSDGGGGIVCC